MIAGFDLSSYSDNSIKICAIPIMTQRAALGNTVLIFYLYVLSHPHY